MVWKKFLGTRMSFRESAGNTCHSGVNGLVSAKIFKLHFEENRLKMWMAGKSDLEVAIGKIDEFKIGELCH